MLPDYNDLYERYDAEQERKLAKLPYCDICGERIQTEHYFDFDGKFICEDCMEDAKRYTDDLIED